MADKTDDLIISISTDLATVRRSLKRLETDIAGSTRVIERQFDGLGKRIDSSLTKSFRGAEAAMARIGHAGADAQTKIARVFAAAASARGAQTLIDSATKIQNSLKVAGLEGDNLKSVYDSLFASAQRNGVPVAELVTLYGRAATAAKELGASQKDLKNFSDTVAMSLKAGGGSAAEASGAMLQLGQAIGGGKVQMEEYGSLLDGARPLLQAVAAGIDEAGGSVAKLTTLVKDGKISSRAFFDGAIAGAPLLAKTLATSEDTISSRFVRLQNVLTDAAGKFDRGVEAGNAFGEALDSISTEIGQVDFDSLSTQLKEISDFLNAGATGLKSWADSLGKISGLRNVGKSILPEGGVNWLGGALTINSTVTPEKMALEAAEKRLSLEKQIADLKALPPNPDLLRTIDKLQTQLSGLPSAAKRQPGITLPAYALPGGTGVAPEAVKPLTLKDYPVDDAATSEKAASAYRDLIKSADDRIGQMKQEVDLLGKFGIEADAARFALDLLQSSEDKGRSLSEGQRKELEKKVALYKQYSETLAKAKLSQDLLDERRLKSMSPQERQIITTQRQYGLPEDLNSPEAGQIRKSLQMDEITSASDAFIDNLSGALLSGGDDIGKKLGQVVMTALLDSAQTQISGVLKKIFGQLLNSAMGDGGSGGAAAVGGIAGKVVGSLGGGATGKAPVIPVSRSMLADVGATKAGSALSQISTSGGLTASVNKKFAENFQGLIDDLEGAGYKIKSLGGYNYRNIAGTNKLSNHAYGNAIDINPGANPMGRNLVTDMPSSVSSLAAQNGLSWGGDWKSKKDAMHFEVPSKDAAAALEKLAASSGDATMGLGKLASGLGSAGGGASGGGGLLSSLLGGLSSYGKSAFSASPQFASAWTKGGIGLYADGGPISGPGSGTSDSIPTMLSDGEFVVRASQSKKHRALLHAINNGTIGHMAMGGVARSIGAPVAPALAARRSASNDNANPGVLQVQIVGANGDDHVRMLVKQGVGEGLNTYNENQRRGGFGTMQSRYGNQKG